MAIEEARQKKIGEMQMQYAQQQEAARREAEAEMQIEMVLRKLLSSEAKARLGNVKLVNKELYLGAVRAVMALYQAGRIQGKIGDSELKTLLGELAVKKETAIRRK